ncbi:hypothetical protein EDD15DRAFT_871447 [Pisolithus albus]|nr:hypothetical protein EDD15DRAFT_871447 [Pisolithus albus]
MISPMQHFRSPTAFTDRTPSSLVKHILPIPGARVAITQAAFRGRSPIQRSLQEVYPRNPNCSMHMTVIPSYFILDYNVLVWCNLHATPRTMLSLRGREVEVLLMQPFRIHSPIGALDRGQTTKMAPILFHASFADVAQSRLPSLWPSRMLMFLIGVTTLSHSLIQVGSDTAEDTPSWPVEYKSFGEDEPCDTAVIPSYLFLDYNVMA